MKEMDLMRAMTDIDEQFIEEAAPAEKQEKRRLILPQAKQWLRGAAVMAVLLLSFTFITGRIGMGKGASGGSAPMLQQSLAVNDEGGMPDEIPAAGAGAPESVAEEAESAASVQNAPAEQAVAASIELMCPQEYGAYVLAEVTYNESGAEAVYRNAQDETGLKITRRPATEEEYRSSDPPVIYGEFKTAEAGTTEAEWTEDGFTYHITVYDDVSDEEMQKLMEEIH